MSIVVQGIGWVTETGFGMTGRGSGHTLREGESLCAAVREQVLRRPMKNLGRLDQLSLLTVTAVSLALEDADVESSPAERQEIGIVATNAEGSSRTDSDYFRDYVENGRRMSRANLFIYTLPSSSMGEAAIHFGLTGPILYTTDGESSLAIPLATAAALMVDGSAPCMLAGKVWQDGALYLFLGRDGEYSLCTLEQAMAVAGGSNDLQELKTSLERLVRGE